MEWSGNKSVHCDGEDTLHNGTNELPLEVRLGIAKLNENRMGQLIDQTTIAIGMKAIVVLNLATKADIANGTWGTIVDIILDPWETQPTIEDYGTVILKMMWMKRTWRRHCTNHFINSFFTVHVNQKGYLIQHRQLAITSGYAFTDYKAQGQTIKYVIINLAPPPSSSMSTFSMYVALSRSWDRNSIRILREYNINTFLNHPLEDLREEMKCLETIAKRTASS